MWKWITLKVIYVCLSLGKVVTPFRKMSTGGEVHPLAVSGAHGVETEATDISDMDLGIRYTWK